MYLPRINLLSKNYTESIVRTEALAAFESLIVYGKFPPPSVWIVLLRNLVTCVAAPPLSFALIMNVPSASAPCAAFTSCSTSFVPLQ